MDGACRAPTDGFTACPARGCPPSSNTRNKDAAVAVPAYASPLNVPVRRKKWPSALPSALRRTLRRMVGSPVQDRHAPWMAHVEPPWTGLRRVLRGAARHPPTRATKTPSLAFQPFAFDHTHASQEVAVGSTVRFAPNQRRMAGSPVQDRHSPWMAHVEPPWTGSRRVLRGAARHPPTRATRTPALAFQPLAFDHARAAQKEKSRAERGFSGPSANR